MRYRLNHYSRALAIHFRWSSSMYSESSGRSPTSSLPRKCRCNQPTRSQGEQSCSRADEPLESEGSLNCFMPGGPLAFVSPDRCPRRRNRTN